MRNFIISKAKVRCPSLPSSSMKRRWIEIAKTHACRGVAAAASAWAGSLRPVCWVGQARLNMHLRGESERSRSKQWDASYQGMVVGQTPVSSGRWHVLPRCSTYPSPPKRTHSSVTSRADSSRLFLLPSLLICEKHLWRVRLSMMRSLQINAASAKLMRCSVLLAVCRDARAAKLLCVCPACMPLVSVHRQRGRWSRPGSEVNRGHSRRICRGIETNPPLLWRSFLFSKSPQEIQVFFEKHGES